MAELLDMIFPRKPGLLDPEIEDYQRRQMIGRVMRNLGSSLQAFAMGKAPPPPEARMSMDEMMRMQSMRNQQREAKRQAEIADRREGAILGPYHPERGGVPWTNPDTGKQVTGGIFDNVADTPQQRALLEAMPRDDAMGVASDRLFPDAADQLTTSNTMLGPNPDDPDGPPVRVPITAGAPAWQKPPDPAKPYSLSPGATRFDADNQQVANVPARAPDPTADMRTYLWAAGGDPEKAKELWRADQEADGQGGTFRGKSKWAQQMEYFSTGDPSSPEYAQVYHDYAQPSFTIDPQTGEQVWRRPDMSNIGPPTGQAGPGGAPGGGAIFQGAPTEQPGGGSLLGQPGAPTGPDGPLLGAEVPPMGPAIPGMSEGTAVEEAFGLQSGIDTIVNNVWDFFGGDLAFPETTEAVSSVRAIMNETVTAISTERGGRPNLMTLKEAQKLVPKAGSIFGTGDETARKKIVVLTERLQEFHDRAAEMAGTAGVGPKNRQDAESDVLTSKRLLKIYGALLERFVKPAGMAPLALGEVRKLPSGLEIWMDAE